MVSEISETDFEYDDWSPDLPKMSQEEHSWSHLSEQLYSPVLFHSPISLSTTKLLKANCPSVYETAIRSIFPKAVIQSFFPMAAEVLSAHISSDKKPQSLDSSELKALYSLVTAEDSFFLLSRCIDQKQFELFAKIVDASDTPVLTPDNAGCLLISICSNKELSKYGETFFFSKACPVLPQELSWYVLKLLIDHGQTDLLFKYLESDKIPVHEPLYSFSILFYIVNSDEPIFEETAKDLIRKLLESPKLTFDQLHADYTIINLSMYGLDFLIEMLGHEKFSNLSLCDKVMSIFIATLADCCCCN